MNAITMRVSHLHSCVFWKWSVSEIRTFRLFRVDFFFAGSVEISEKVRLTKPDVRIEF